MREPSRRRLLASIASAGVLSGAGCLGNQSSPEAAASTGTDEPSTEASTDDESTASEKATSQPRSDLGGWTMEGRDATRTAYAPDTTGPEEDVTRQWTAEAPEQTRAPVVADGRVFATGGGDVVAFDAVDGSALWQFTTEADRVTPATVVGDTVLTCSKSSTYALSVVDGRLRWQRDDVGMNGVGLPVADDDTFYVVGSGSPGPFYALSIADGTTRWTSTNEYGMISCRSALADGALVATPGSTVVAVDTETGEELWTWGSQQRQDVRSTPAIADGTVYFWNQGGLVFALDLETGGEVWNYNAESMNTKDLALSVVDGTLLVPGDRGLEAIDAESGEQRWRREIAGEVAPVVAGDTIYASATNREKDDGTFATPFVAGYTLEDGMKRWEHSIDDNRPVGMKPAVADGTLFVGSVNGTVYALEEP